MPALAASMSFLGRLRLDDRGAHPHEVGDPLGMRCQLQERKHDHPAQAVPDPVHPVLPGLSFHVIRMAGMS